MTRPKKMMVDLLNLSISIRSQELKHTIKVQKSQTTSKNDTKFLFYYNLLLQLYYQHNLRDELKSEFLSILYINLTVTFSLQVNMVNIMLYYCYIL